VTRQNIVRLLDELELSPNTSFEHDLVHDMESVSVTADSMRAVKRYNDEVFLFSVHLLPLQQHNTL